MSSHHDSSNKRAQSKGNSKVPTLQIPTKADSQNKEVTFRDGSEDVN